MMIFTRSIKSLNILSPPICQRLGDAVKINGSRFSSTKEPSIPKNVAPDTYTAKFQQKNGKVYDKKPFKIRLYPEKDYFWCLCGLSKNQPMCDSTHKEKAWKCTLRPIKFRVEKEKDYWLCNCKQTKLRPFCDGTHKEL